MVFWLLLPIDIHGRAGRNHHPCMPIKKAIICLVDSEEQGQGCDSYLKYAMRRRGFEVFILFSSVFESMLSGSAQYSTCCQEHATMNPRLKMQRKRWVSTLVLCGCLLISGIWFRHRITRKHGFQRTKKCTETNKQAGKVPGTKQLDILNMNITTNNNRSNVYTPKKLTS